ncbi:VOC family protein [Nocardioides sp. zg-536]|uniref:VOC family protein n=1 Tax=Nocardioides faecalis TaxID=2803858 RepID=A0A938Y615_9ACTN|nr:VOC family protein [Nocardioides faecalis]MBM9458535.1 VOC family protein [Nocardioides faecalis]MBS4752866.1 VOC family protein [Nocardioides faecalis]QVI58538.1 VOC family protein [Nocardioides faecalis]
MAIARNPHVVLDCPDPAVLAEFYGAVLGWSPSLAEDGGWATISSGDHYLHFQRVEGFQAPSWPGQEVPQQFHVDVDVDDLDEGEAAVLGLGATKHAHQPGTSFRVFLDPAGHPFCLCQA